MWSDRENNCSGIKCTTSKIKEKSLNGWEESAVGSLFYICKLNLLEFPLDTCLRPIWFQPQFYVAKVVDCFFGCASLVFFCRLGQFDDVYSALNRANEQIVNFGVCTHPLAAVEHPTRLFCFQSIG